MVHTYQAFWYTVYTTLCTWPHAIVPRLRVVLVMVLVGGGVGGWFGGGGGVVVFVVGGGVGCLCLFSNSENNVMLRPYAHVIIHKYM